MKKFKSLEFIDEYRPFGIINGAEKQGTEYPVHKHEFIELVYVSEGETTHTVDGVPFRVNSGEILVIDYNQSHSFCVHRDVLYFNLLIKPEYISRTLANAENIYDVFSFFVLDKYFDSENNRHSVIRFSGTEKLEMDALAEKMNAERKAKEPGYELAMEGYMCLIFSKIIRVLRKSSAHNFFHAITPGLLAYIDANFTQKLTIAELADKCFYNPAYLGRVFKNTFHVTLHEYVNEKRVAYAKKILVETDEPVEAIGAQIGYADRKQFYKEFKEKVGCTPKQYRENYRRQ